MFSHNCVIKKTVSLFWKTHESVVRYNAHIKFLNVCKKSGTVPTFAKIRNITNSKNGQCIALRTSQAFIKEAIDLHYRDIKYANERAFNLYWELVDALNYDELNIIIGLKDSKCEKLKRKLHLKHVKKLLRLNAKWTTIARMYDYQQHEYSKKRYNVCNLSEVDFSDTELSLLSKGLKYVPRAMPNTETLLNLVYSIEKAAKKLPRYEANNLLMTTCNTIHNVRKKRFNNCDIKAIKTIRGKCDNNSLVILPSDKENTPTIISREKYINHVKAHLDSDTYKPLNSDPTNEVKAFIKKKLIKLRTDGMLNEDIHKKLEPPKDSRCPMFYMRPKLHKGLGDLKFRPVVAYIDAPTGPIARYTTKIITSLLPEATYVLKNGRAFVKKVQHSTIRDEEAMASLDIVSLYTSIPHMLALDALADLLFDVNPDTLPASVYTIIELVRITIGSTYFSFNEKWYTQNIGLPMGSPLSSPLSEIVVRRVEEKIRNTIPYQLAMYHRYVDDIFVILEKNNSNDVLSFFNSIEPAIQFTIELEANNKLPYLDVLNIRSEGLLHTTVYRKPSRPLTTLHFDSSHPHQHKCTAVLFQYDRAKEYCCETHLYANEIKTINNIYNSGYPHSFIQRIVNKKATRKNHRVRPSPSTAYVSIPYVNGSMLPVYQACRSCQQEPVWKPGRSLGELVSHPKIGSGLKNQEGVIYKIKCDDCPATYIGQTGRRVTKRAAEHLGYIRRKEYDKSPIVSHVWDNNHNVGRPSFSIIHQEKNFYKRTAYERFLINAYSATCINKKEEGIVSPVIQNLVTDLCKTLTVKNNAIKW